MAPLTKNSGGSASDKVLWAGAGSQASREAARHPQLRDAHHAHWHLLRLEFAAHRAHLLSIPEDRAGILNAAESPSICTYLHQENSAEISLHEQNCTCRLPSCVRIHLYKPSGEDAALEGGLASMPYVLHARQSLCSGLRVGPRTEQL
jgi:hypothetical protein